MKHLARLFLITLMVGAFFSSASTVSAEDLAVSSVSVTPSATEFTVQWVTNAPASSQVLYGTTSSLGNSTTEINTDPRVTQHSVTVSGLQSCTTYYYQAKSVSLSYVNTNGISEISSVKTAGCTAEVSTVDSTDEETLAETGPSTTAYLIIIGSILAIMGSAAQLRKN